MTDTSAQREARKQAIIVFGIIVGAILLSLYMAAPPRPVPARAPATEFSAERALVYDRGVASVPHPAGSPENEKTRAYIVDTLRAMGVDAKTESGTYVRGHSAGEVTNVYAKIPGTANTKAFALEAHYDSVPYGPGAADDCAGVAAMMETARVLKAGPPLKNDIIFVFSDAEEGGLLGARAFAGHPWFNDVGVMLNFEARGTKGMSFMFETSPENGWLIREMIKAGVEPRANSLCYDVYSRMPFSSDFSALKPRGAKGFNVAFVDNFANYHTRDDSPDNLNLASLQHHGTYALGLARHFGNIPLDQVTAPDATYFNTVGSHMVCYPLTWGKPLAWVAYIALAIVVLFGLVRRHLSLLGLIAGIIVFPLSAAAACAVTGLLLALAYGPHDLYTLYTVDITYIRDLRILYNNNTYGLAFALIAVGVVCGLYVLWRRWIKTQNLAMGALASWAALLVFFEQYLPGGSYLPMWTVFFASLGMAALFLERPDEPPRLGFVLGALVFAMPGILFLAPSYQGFLSTVMVIAAPGLVILPILMTGLIIPQLELMARPSRCWLPTTLGCAGLAIYLFALATSGVSPTRPKLDCLSYGLNLDKNEAFWLSHDQTQDEWTSQFFPMGTERAQIQEFMPGHDKEYLKAPAAIAPLTGPQIAIVSDTTADGVREVTLHIDALGKPNEMHLHLHGADVFSSTVFGEQSRGERHAWKLDFNLFPPEGTDVVLRMAPSRPFEIKAIEEYQWLPECLNVPPRPPHIITQPNTVFHGHRLNSSHTFVAKTFSFPA